MEPEVSESPVNEQKSSRARERAIDTAVNRLREISNTKAQEQHVNGWCDRIAFKDKVQFLVDHPFLRSLQTYDDCDEVWEDLKKTVVAGTKKSRSKANDWIKDNEDAFNAYNKFKLDRDRAEIIQSTIGDGFWLNDPDALGHFLDTREENMECVLKGGFLRLGYERKKKDYIAGTEATAEYMKMMIADYQKFREDVGRDYDNMTRAEFFNKYTYSGYLIRS